MYYISRDMHVDMDMNSSNSHSRWYLMLVIFRNISLKALFTHGKYIVLKSSPQKQQHRREYDFNDPNHVMYLMSKSE